VSQQNLPLVWNRPVDPARDKDFHKRKVKPVTLEDIGGTYLTAGLRRFEIEDGRINTKKLKESLDQWHNPRLEPGESSPDLMKHNFGCALWPHISLFRASNWEDALEEINKRGLYLFDCWHTMATLEEGGYSWIVPDEVQDYLKEKIGKYFLGWDNGEQDGRWFWQNMRSCPTPSDRKEVWRYFEQRFSEYIADLKNYTIACCGLTYPHYFAKMEGTRMIGAEFIQALPGINMWASWVRGAARQYQILWQVQLSIFNAFGYKTFEKDSFRNLFKAVDFGIGNPTYQGGPDRGPSLSLIRHAWYVLFMYGANVECIEDSQFFRPAGAASFSIPSSDEMPELAPEAKKEYLSPLGDIQLQVVRFCTRNAERRGVQYCPSAALMDFYNAWTPPRHIYTDSFYITGGMFPYHRGDHQTDLFFREIFPEYQDCAYFRNERGYLTSTPYGDITDVLLTDVRPHILTRYRMVSLLGHICVEGELLAKLKEYAENGGHLVWSTIQLGREAMELSGAILTGEQRKANLSRDITQGTVYQEEDFTFTEVRTSGCDILLETEDGHPLMFKRPFGSGQITTMNVPYGLCDKINEPHPLIGADPERDVTTFSYFDKPLGSPYIFLNGIKQIWFSMLKALNLIEVYASEYPIDKDNLSSTSAIQYITNLTGEENRLVITLVNNNLFPVYALIQIKGAKIKKALDLLHGERQMPLDENGQLSVTLFPSDNADFNLYIIELETDRPVVRFVQET